MPSDGQKKSIRQVANCYLHGETHEIGTWCKADSHIGEVNAAAESDSSLGVARVSGVSGGVPSREVGVGNGHDRSRCDVSRASGADRADRGEHPDPGEGAHPKEVGPSTTPSTRCDNCGGTGWTLCEDGSGSDTRCPVGCPLRNPGDVRTVSVMLDRVRAGEPLDEVMADYGYVPSDEVKELLEQRAEIQAKAVTALREADSLRAALAKADEAYERSRAARGQAERQRDKAEAESEGRRRELVRVEEQLRGEWRRAEAAEAALAKAEATLTDERIDRAQAAEFDCVFRDEGCTPVRWCRRHALESKLAKAREALEEIGARGKHDYAGRGHHCDWRSHLQAVNDRARTALAAIQTEPVATRAPGPDDAPTSGIGGASVAPQHAPETAAYRKVKP